MMITPSMIITAIKPTAYKRRSASIIKDGINIPTNLPEAKSGTKSMKKRDFWSKSGTQKKKKIYPDVYFSFFCDQTLDKLNLSPSYVWITKRRKDTINFMNSHRQT